MSCHVAGDNRLGRACYTCYLLFLNTLREVVSERGIFGGKKTACNVFTPRYAACFRRAGPIHAGRLRWRQLQWRIAGLGFGRSFFVSFSFTMGLSGASAGDYLAFPID